MAEIGFVGLGMMGAPMAQGLLNSGVALKVFDIRPEAVATCEANGATGVAAPREMVDCSTVLVIVHSGDQVRDVVLGENGLLAGAAGGALKTIVIMSTVTPMLVRELAEKTTAAGIEIVDAPVSGGPIIAQMGQLSFMAGGDPGVIESLTPLFDAMGKGVFHVGDLGSGMAAKLVNNMVALNNAYTFTEALSIGIAGGLTVDKTVEIMQASSGRNWCTDNWEIYKGFFSLVLSDPNFHLTAEKDIETAMAWTREMGVPAPSLEHILSIIKASQGVSEALQKALQGG